jgi:hypothetical protein
VKPGKTVGVYDRPPPRKWPKLLAIAVAVLISIVIAMLMMNRARAAEAVIGGLIAPTVAAASVGFPVGAPAAEP